MENKWLRRCATTPAPGGEWSLRPPADGVPCDAQLMAGADLLGRGEALDRALPEATDGAEPDLADRGPQPPGLGAAVATRAALGAPLVAVVLGDGVDVEEARLSGQRSPSSGTRRTWAGRCRTVHCLGGGGSTSPRIRSTRRPRPRRRPHARAVIREPVAKPLQKAHQKATPSGVMPHLSHESSAARLTQRTRLSPAPSCDDGRVPSTPIARRR